MGDTTSAMGRASIDGEKSFDFAKLSTLRENLVTLVAASIFLNVLGLAMPMSLLQIYDRILPNRSSGTMMLLLSIVVAALLMETALNFCRSYVSGWVGARFEHKAGRAAFERLIGTSLANFSRHATGVYLEWFNSIAVFREFYEGQSLATMLDLPFVVIYFGLVAFMGGPLVIVPILILAALTFVAFRTGHSLRRAIRDRTTADDRRFNFVIEVLTGIHGVKTLAMEHQMVRRYERLQENSAEKHYQVALGSARAGSIAVFFAQATTILVVAAGSLRVIDGHMTTGALAACALLAGRAMMPLGRALGVWTRFQSFVLARHHLTKLFAPTPESAGGLPPLTEITGELELCDVGFQYGEDGATILSGATLRLMPGECVAISGTNGSGKSTLLALMQGALRPTHGTVLLDGQDLAQFDPISVRRHIAYLPQNGVLFQGSILDNITLFRPHLEQTGIEIASKLGLDDVISGMPMGFDTIVGDGAHDTLPRGIKQRIAIARSLVDQPKVILFDEANAGIDSAGDNDLRAWLEGVKGHCTMVLVTHRPSLLKLADRVFDLDRGCLMPHRPGAVHAAANPTPGLSLKEVLANRQEQDELDGLGGLQASSDIAACLLPLLRALEWKGPPRQVAEALPHFAEDLDLTGLRNVMAHLNYDSRPQRLKLDEIDPRLMPCLFLPDKQAALVIKAVQGEHYTVYDSARDQTILLTDPHDVAGTAYFFTPLVEEPPSPSRASWFAGVIGRFRPLFIQAFVVTFLLNVMSLGTPLFVMAIYDKVVGAGSLEMLAAFTLGAALALGFDFALRGVRARLLAYVGARLDTIMGNSIFGHILLLPAGFTERATVGAQVSRLKDFESVRDFFTGPLATVMMELPFALFYFAIIFALGGVLALVPVVATFLFALGAMAITPAMRKTIASGARAMARRQEFLVEALGKMAAIKLAAGEPQWTHRYREISAQAAYGGFKATLAAAAAAIISGGMIIFVGMATIATGVLGVINQNMTTGGLIASMMLVWRVLSPLQTAFSMAQRIEQVRGSISQINGLMSLKPEHAPDAKPMSGSHFKGKISFSRVSLRYNTISDPALVGVSFDIEPGEVVAIAGRGGSGKSTLLSLILGLYVPQAGSVRLDGTDIRQMDPIELRHAIAYVPQTCNLFYGTIAQNLRLAHPTATEADLRRASQMSGILDDIEVLPLGFDTRIDDRDIQHLSASFVQKLSLARAYLKQSPLMLFDEPVNGLDFEGDSRFMETISQLRGQSTILMVTHRPSHLRMADKVMVLDGGYLRIIGPPGEVMPRVPVDML